MTLSEALEKISKALGVLTHQVYAENLAGLLSKNRLVEDLLLPVFRIALNSLQLRNVNQLQTNFPYIDLADDQKRLAIQITTERTAAKITETVTNFVANGYASRYDRLIFFLLTTDKPRYTAKTKSQWKAIASGKLRFEPASDIIATPQLFKILQSLPQHDIYAIEEIVARSILGESFVDVDHYLAKQSQVQLEYEKKSGKYIPDVFVETRETKNLARTFAHPVLFSRRTLESLERTKICGPHTFLEKAGLPALPFPDLARHKVQQDLSNVDRAARALSAEFSSLN